MNLKAENFNVLKGLVSAVFFLLVTGAVTGLIQNPLYVRMVPITVFDYFFFTVNVGTGRPVLWKRKMQFAWR